MANEPSIEEAVERARRAQDDRINAVRSVAEMRQQLADVREQTERELAEVQARIKDRVRQAEQDDVKAFNAALRAGWSAEELQSIGFSNPTKKPRARRRAPRKPAQQANTPQAPESHHQDDAAETATHD